MFSRHSLVQAGRWAAATVFAWGLLWQAALTAEKPASGPLRIHPENSRYFCDGTGNAVYLTGTHTWNNLQDFSRPESEGPFDFDAYLDFLVQHNHNFFRLWRWDLLAWDTSSLRRETSPACYAVAPHPWPRTGPGNALDGKPKFDLALFDQAYFKRLRSRVEAAGKHGIYVSVMLFEGWALRFMPGGWKAHPFHPDNNINRLEDQLPPDMKGPELFTLASPEILNLQAAYVRKVIDTVGDLDNVLYEIANESELSSTEWQYHWIRTIREYEAERPKQHPVGMTSRGFSPEWTISIGC